jgi:hypothetical protein
MRRRAQKYESPRGDAAARRESTKS